MRTKTINWYEGRSGNRASRFFYPEGRTYSPPRRGGGIASDYIALATVRSARRMRLLRKPYGQCHTSAELLSLSTQTAICFASSSKQLFPKQNQLAACQ